MSNAEAVDRYRKTKNGLITKIYCSQRRNSKHRGHDLPNYSREELKNWLLSQDKFHELYENWVLSGFNKDLVPSCDRIDDYKGYSIRNISLTTWKKNNNRFDQDRKNGINNKLSKAVIQYDLSGNFINSFFSISHAQRETGIGTGSIVSNCKNKRKTAGGFIWRYKNYKI